MIYNGTLQPHGNKHQTKHPSNLGINRKTCSSASPKSIVAFTSAGSAIYTRAAPLVAPHPAEYDVNSHKYHKYAACVCAQVCTPINIHIFQFMQWQFQLAKPRNWIMRQSKSFEDAWWQCRAQRQYNRHHSWL